MRFLAEELCSRADRLARITTFLIFAACTGGGCGRGWGVPYRLKWGYHPNRDVLPVRSRVPELELSVGSVPCIANSQGRWIKPPSRLNGKYRCIIPSPPKSYATIPYIRNISESVLAPLNIRTCFKPHQTLRNLLVHVKDPTPPESRKGVVYQVSCSDCPATYIGQTGRTITHRIKEHKYALTSGNPENSAVAKHSVDSGHAINWGEAQVTNVVFWSLAISNTSPTPSTGNKDSYHQHITSWSVRTHGHTCPVILQCAWPTPDTFCPAFLFVVLLLTRLFYVYVSLPLMKTAVW